LIDGALLSSVPIVSERCAAGAESERVMQSVRDDAILFFNDDDDERGLYIRRSEIAAVINGTRNSGRPHAGAGTDGTIVLRNGARFDVTSPVHKHDDTLRLSDYVFGKDSMDACSLCGCPLDHDV
jgi:hypothetical protein